MMRMSFSLLQSMNVNPNPDEQSFIPYIYIFHSCIAQVFIYLVPILYLAVKARVLYILNCKYAFEMWTSVCLTWITLQLLVYEVFKVYCLGSVHADSDQVGSTHPSHNPCIFLF